MNKKIIIKGKFNSSGRDYLHSEVYTKTTGLRLELLECDNGTIALDHIDSCKGLVKNDTCTCPK